MKGRFRAIKVLKRGVSPRVVKARIVGSRGSTVVTGPQIRARLGLRDTWFHLRRVSTQQVAGAEARTLRGARPLVALHGTIDAPRRRDGHAPAPHRRRLEGRGHLPGAERRLPRSTSARAGIYRVTAGWAPGPAVRVDPPAIG